MPKVSTELIKSAIAYMEATKAWNIEHLRWDLKAAERIDRWLDAEKQYRTQVKDWLRAEEYWHKVQFAALAMSNKVSFRAAKLGWIRQKQALPNLDGVSRFEDLSLKQQARYARFAAGVLGIDDGPYGDEEI